MAEADAPLVTVAELEAFTGQSFDSTRAAVVIDLASSAVRSWCRWHISPSLTETLMLDGSGTYTFELPSLYVTDVAEVTVDGDPVDLDVIEWSRRGQIRHKHRKHFTDALGGVTVSLTHGLDCAPGTVKSAVMSAAQRAMLGDPGVQSDSTRVGQLSETRTYATGSDATTGTVDLSRREMGALGPWRLPSQQGDG